MEKFRKDVVFEGINENIKETIKEQMNVLSDIDFLDDYCDKHDIQLLLEVDNYNKTYCFIGYNDAETSEKICDALLDLYEVGKIYDEKNHTINIKLLAGDIIYQVCMLELKDYTELTIVDKKGNETDIYDSDFIENVVNAIDLSLYNGNLQHTTIYKDTFPNGDDIDDEEYNDRYNKLIDRILTSVKHYMYSDTERRFDVDYSTHYQSCYFFFEVPSIRDYYMDDICDVLDYKNR